MGVEFQSHPPAKGSKWWNVQSIKPAWPKPPDEFANSTTQERQDQGRAGSYPARLVYLEGEEGGVVCLLVLNGEGRRGVQGKRNEIKFIPRDLSTARFRATG